MRDTLLISLILLGLLSGAAANAQPLKPFKDDLFAYPGILSQADDGSRVVVDYQEMRDINGRDEVPERRVQGNYVRLSVRSVQKELALPTPAGTIRHFAVGRQDGARVIVLYLHGQGGNRRQGVDDFTFGGNFNRIKNLMWENDGLYLSPDVNGFDAGGVAQVAALMAHYHARSPRAAVFVACGSMGGAICWGLARDATASAMLSGLLLLGSFPGKDFTTSAAFRRKVPVYLGQGSRDTVFPVETIEAFHATLRKAQPAYPIRLARFETGTHGTPIRMTDWRLTLNWMLSRRP